MYGLQEKAKCETVGHYSNKPIHPMDAITGSPSTVGVVRAIEMLENELQIQRNLIGSLIERLDQYTDKADAMVNAAHRVSKGQQPILRVYECPKCKGFHLTKQRKD